MSSARSFAAALLATASQLILGCGTAPTEEAKTPPSQPNILLLVVDDLGWADLQNLHREAPQHSEHIRALTDRGLRFTHAYANAANCAPSRAALMSGLHAARTGVYTVGSGKRGLAARRMLVPPPNRTSLAAEFETLPERMQELGYRTGFIGKWHLGSEEEGLLPEQQGFEFSRAGDEHGHPPSYLYPYARKANRLPDLSGPEQDADRAGEYLTDRLTEEALGFLREGDGRPWFLTLSYYAVHTPIQGTPEMRAAAQGSSPVGDQRPLYTQMISKVDDSVGRLMDFIDAAGVDENTMVILTSDNGGLGGYRAAGVPGSPEVTSNAPLLGGKGMFTEGGIRVPLLVSMPGLIESSTTSAQPVQLFDLYPTLVEVGGGEPTRRLPSLDEDSFAPDGVSLWSHLQAPTAALADRSLYWHFPGYLESGRENWRSTPTSVIRRGKWKLRFSRESGAAVLSDLESDPGETRDYAATQPEVARRLRAELDAWLRETHAPRAMPAQSIESGG